MILSMIIVILYLERRYKMKPVCQSSHNNSDYDDRTCYIPVYRYNCRPQIDFYNV